MWYRAKETLQNYEFIKGCVYQVTQYYPNYYVTLINESNSTHALGYSYFKEYFNECRTFGIPNYYSKLKLAFI